MLICECDTLENVINKNNPVVPNETSDDQHFRSIRTEVLSHMTASPPREILLGVA